MNEQITLQCSCLDRLSLAIQQNYIPTIQSILLKNEGEQPVEGLKVSITCEPHFAADFSADIDRIDPLILSCCPSSCSR